MDQITKHNWWMQAVEEFRSSRRNLPHLQDIGGYYFTDSNTHLRRVLTPDERNIVMTAIRFMDGRKYVLDAAVVMPDHVHLLLRPLPKSSAGVYSLSEIFHSIKSFSGNKIGGAVWQSENYDHFIRNEADYYEKLQYLLYNPFEAGLCESPFDYQWLYWIGMQQLLPRVRRLEALLHAVSK